jgi:hypothetical protein
MLNFPRTSVRFVTGQSAKEHVVASAVINIAPDEGDRRVRTVRSSRVPKANSVINPNIRKLPTHVRGPQSTENMENVHDER